MKKIKKFNEDFIEPTKVKPTNIDLQEWIEMRQKLRLGSVVEESNNLDDDKSK